MLNFLADRWTLLLLLMSEEALVKQQGVKPTDVCIYIWTHVHPYVHIDEQKKGKYTANISSCSSFPDQVIIDAQIRSNPGN